MEAAFNSLEAGAPIQQPFRSALADFLEDSSCIHDGYVTKLQQKRVKLATPVAPPVVPAAAAATVASAKVAAAPAVETVSNNREDKLIKGLETKIDRKRREIKDKYRKRRCRILVSITVTDLTYLLLGTSKPTR